MAELSIEINSQGAAAPALAQTLSQWALNLRFDQAPIYVQ